MSIVNTPRIAANPIPYWIRGGKTRAVFEQAFADFAEIGYTAVKADVPEDAREITSTGSVATVSPRRSACSAPPSTRPSTSPTRLSGQSGSPAPK